MPLRGTIARCARALPAPARDWLSPRPGVLSGHVPSRETVGTDGGGAMDQQQLLVVALLVAAGAGVLATLAILRRIRIAREEASRESPFAASGEGVKLCPSCATENLSTDSRCVRCGRKLPDAQRAVW